MNKPSLKDIIYYVVWFVITAAYSWLSGYLFYRFCVEWEIFGHCGTGDHKTKIRVLFFSEISVGKAAALTIALIVVFIAFHLLTAKALKRINLGLVVTVCISILLIAGAILRTSNRVSVCEDFLIYADVPESEVRCELRSVDSYNSTLLHGKTRAKQRKERDNFRTAEDNFGCNYGEGTGIWD